MQPASSAAALLLLALVGGVYVSAQTLTVDSRVPLTRPAAEFVVTTSVLPEAIAKVSFPSMKRLHVEVLQVGVCNQTAAALDIPTTRLFQLSLAKDGITALSHDVAFAVITAASATSPWGRTARVAITAIELAALIGQLKGLSTGWQAGLTTSAVVGSSGLAIFQSNLAPNSYLTLDKEMPPQDQIHLEAMKCSVPYLVLAIDPAKIKPKDAAKLGLDRREYSIAVPVTH